MSTSSFPPSPLTAQLRRRCLPLLVALTAAFVPMPEVHAAIKVVATVPDLAAIASAVGGDAIAVKSLSLPSQDPHFVDAKPSLALELNRAQLLLTVGLELEVGWLPNLLVGARNPAIQPGSPGHLDCSKFVTRLDIPGGPVDRSQGDIHPGGNPHYLYDPRAALAVGAGIAQRLAELVPDKAASIRANLAAWQKDVDAARLRWERRLAPLRGQPVLSYHKTWTYLADWLGFVPVGTLEPKPGLPPSPSHIARLLGLARSRKVTLVLQEQHYPEATAQLVASKIPAALVRIPAATNVPAGETYLQHLEVMLQAIARGVGVEK